MKKGDIVTGIVESIDFPNKCHVRVNEEETVTVKNAILGQKVSVRVLKKKSGKATGNVLEVLAPGPCETRTPCKDFGLCGGCVYNPVDYTEELSLKESQIKKLLDGVIRTPYEFEPIQGSPISSGYRNKMEFSFGDLEKDGPMTLGMHRRGSFYDIV
ncbi:MAG: 23S rRNA (uracil-5-)-methyltransferase RumA, partial [Lachnospiraceae bacterium]|nr:23S rRNA (uracil-5-)-methyltransferase RumA [Lachnospiraceae bacterium]